MLASKSAQTSQKVARRAPPARRPARPAILSIDAVDEPLRGETYSAEHLANHAALLASTHQVSSARADDNRFRRRFEENGRFIAATYHAITAAVRDGEPISPDAEWLLDNYYVVEEQLREIREDLPRKYYIELPKLADGPRAQYPRVYDLAHELVIHTDSSLDKEIIAQFVTAYQQVAPLTSGEVWAVPIMLRLVLVENLRRLCGHMVAMREHRREAEKLLAAWQPPRPAPARLAALSESHTFVVQLIECLRDSGGGQRAACHGELEQRLAEREQTIDDCVRREQHRLAANQVSIGNLITSMRLISALDWTLFFEKVSLVEQVLREDPAGVYARMDFATRDGYRHEIERLAKRSNRPETHVASAAVERARHFEATSDADARHRHVGYFLIGEGRLDLEKSLDYRPTWNELVARTVRRHAAITYLGGISALTLAGVAVVVILALFSGAGAIAAAVLGVLAVLPASELAVSIANFVVTNRLRPRALPKLEFTDHVPDEFQTLVVVPSMLTSEKGVRSLLERLEIHSLANPEVGLKFALLTDFADAPQAVMPQDTTLLAQARSGIQALNARYDQDEGDRFFLLHRERRWNPVEKTWMGWERKRGKLLELNRLLRGAADTTFVLPDGAVDALAGIKYVITLDADTRLPHAAAKRLVGAMAHPLNRPYFDAARERVTRGFGVMQPRVSVSLVSAGRSIYSRIWANSPGLDPYCTAVSDVYQDLFGEGSYTGKGIYDVDAFSAATDESFPENQILSHDLIEGCFARVGLATDIEFFDEFPSRFDADARRQHRWVRGDWQLLPWLFPSVPTSSGKRSNPLTVLSWWKVFDNLRRSLLSPALVLFLLVGWLLFPSLSVIATLSALVVLASPLLTHLFSALRFWPTGIDWRLHATDTLRDLGRTSLQCVLSLAFLPYKAQLMLDAVGRTLYRLFVSHERLLEWETADAAERRLKRNPWASVREMGLVSLASVAVALFLPPTAYLAAFPVLALWFLSPLLAFGISRPADHRPAPLRAEQRRMLRRVARKTWAFFEAFVGPEDHWLPPDNYQEFPRPKIAHRVSPTNEGLLIVSALAARDFGYIALTDLQGLLQKNVDTLEHLERHRGHFYNWYDTTTLLPLAPRYISTADSGNLAGCLLTARMGIVELLQEPIFDERCAEGLLDSVDMASEALARVQPKGARFVSAALDALEAGIETVRNAASTLPRRDMLDWREMIESLQRAARELPVKMDQFEKAVGLKATEASAKIRLLVLQIEGLLRDLEAFYPWTPTISSTESDAHRAAARTQWQLPWVEGPWQSQWNVLQSQLVAPTSLEQVIALPQLVAANFESLRQEIRGSGLTRQETNPLIEWVDRLFAGIESAARQADECRRKFLKLARRYESLAWEMDFSLLYNSQRRLFTVGFNLEDSRPDRAHYDLLASEARLASLIAIAKGDTEYRHWFQLSRTLTHTGGARSLLSWGGTMFEYLMPTLFASDVKGSLLEQSCQAAVNRQIAYGKQQRIPWGISESAFAAFGVNSDYHYQSFGVPGLGLKRGLAKDLVISPYSTALAAPINPTAAADNFRALAEEGADGPWGFYDAIDYTPERVPESERRTIVFCYMAHHHGMTIAALANCLLANCMQRRFQGQPLARATELLLQERVPTAVLEFQPHGEEASTVTLPPETIGPVSRRLATPMTVVPRIHLLSNGQYTVMLTNAGGGYSRCRDLAITRWRADTTRDAWGQFIYVRDMASGKFWSAGYHPARVQPDRYEVVYSLDKAEFRRTDGDFETHLEVAVSHENNAEVRQVTITNHGRRRAVIELTSYAEVVLSSAAADLAHPAFNKLFVETEYLADRRALVARRRPRDSSQKPIWAVHVLATIQASEGREEYETDRARFVGRGRTLAQPAAMGNHARLSGTTGPVLDPILSLRRCVSIAPEESASLAFITAFADSREEAIALADQYHDPRTVQRTFELAWAHSQVELRHLHAAPASVQIYQRLASAVLFPDASLRASALVLKSNQRGQTALWKFGISGDDPIVLVRISQPEHRALVREMLLAHEFWHSHGLKVDLVVLNEHPAGYFDDLSEQLMELIQTTVRATINKSGGVYLLRGGHVSDEDRVLLQAVAAINLHGERGSFLRQVEMAELPRQPQRPLLRPTRSPQPRVTATLPSKPAAENRFANSLGAFRDDGREYVVHLKAGQWTPAPWSNVIANPEFGFLVTESGGGFSWAGNSRENKITEWSNDPVMDTPGEILYVRDDETGELFSPMPLPIRDESDYQIHHGRGYSRFVHQTLDIHQDLHLSVAPHDPIKLICLRLHNESDRPRQLSVAYYAEWVLGVNRQSTQRHVWTDIDDATGALVAHNHYHEDVPGQIAFLHVVGRPFSATGDRSEFVGRNGDWRQPAGLMQVELSGTTGARLDPCGAVQTRIKLAPGEETEVVILLGSCADSEELADLLGRYSTPRQVHAAIDRTRSFWDHTLQTIQVQTPNPALDLLVNHWLLYQTLSCRFWGRSGFYQAGGAYGFRDQLQDAMALVYAVPRVAREHILRAASRQFEPGDVQHWWHPPTGRGVRTRFADDYLWLPLVTSHYIRTTGDVAILDEEVPYLISPLLEPHEDERYERPEVSSTIENLYSHCLRAIDHGFRFGPHGLPLMGAGDWNDGMNKVGAHGRGESVWMAWFLIEVLREFLPLMRARGDDERAAAYDKQCAVLRQAIDQHAWDGAWYRRAFFDDGTPLGSAQNDECRIDSLAQSWSVIVGGNNERSQMAMNQLDHHLIRRNDRLILLLDPPFDQTPLDPGYIKGYLPGIRENGGQYTHAAIWVVWATTFQKNGHKALELFDLINPVLHSCTPHRLGVYRTEPYVIAADVYGRPPHTGRGGWTWYTGSASWMYRVAVERILGLQLRGDRLTFDPCIPSDWPSFDISFRRGNTTWRIRVSNPSAVEHGVKRVTVDGQRMPSNEFALTDDGRDHAVEIELGSP
jgi:cyclic beta-1,2-glucan synthetase